MISPGAVRLMAIVVVVALAAACSNTTTTPKATRHVFIIVMENKSPEEALRGTFTASLAANNGIAANYRAITHPSVPNYLALTSGSTWGVQDDSYHQLPRTDIGDQLTTAGITWRAYMEGLGSQGCINSPLPYDPGHNPFAFYGGQCPQNVVPFTQLSADLAKNTPLFTWITPDRCHDQHSCPVSAGDDWLRQTVPMITSSGAWKADGVLFIVWDEDDGSADNRVLALVIRPGVGHKVSQAAYNHYSLLATIENVLGVSPLGEAGKAHPMTDLT